ncbi:MAG: hypothetical protein GC149_03320 [Gammaproteobacteria bacterium]|nr:hypothetical protein [Gammaproteobacteria bacterium]
MSRCIFIVICLLSAGVVHAASDKLNNFWLSYSQDDNETSAVAALLTLGLGLDDQLIFGYGRNETTYNSQSLTTNDYAITYSTLRPYPWSLDLGYDYWGKDQQLVVKTISAAPTWHGKSWSLGVQLEHRTVTFYSRQFASGQRSWDVDSDGLGPVIDLVAGNWSWSLTGMIYDYSRDISVNSTNFPRLNLFLTLKLLGRDTFLHATTLTDWYATTQLKYKFKKYALGAKYSHSISALDQQATDSVSALCDIDLSKTTSLELEAGRVYAPNDLTSDFASAGLSIDF